MISRRGIAVGSGIAAEKTFGNTIITIKEGKRMLDSVIGTELECKNFFEFQ